MKIQCINCKKDIPEIKDVLRNAKRQVLPKYCLTCKPQAPRQSLKPFTEKKK